MSNSFSALEGNKGKIVDIFGNDFCNKSINDTLPIEESLEANDHLANLMYGKEISELLKNRQMDELESRYTKLYDQIVSSNKELDGLDLSEIGLLLVRPETFARSEEYIKFLENLKLQVLLSKDTTIDFDKYWLLYNHALIIKDTMVEFPTRTFNYILNSCKLLVVTKSDLNKSNDSVSTILSERKGEVGVSSPGTFRGDIGYQLLKEYVIAPNTFTKEANIALDPIGMYRLITRSLVPSDNRHVSATIPLLAFAGQTVHIPNDEEISKDISVLCDSEDIKFVKKLVQGGKK